MKGSFKNTAIKIRRSLLNKIVPEFIWPKDALIDGTKIQIRNTPYSVGTKWILRKGTYEVAERKLISRFLKPGLVVFEMGASVGILTAIMSQIVGALGKIISVEASENLTSFSRIWLEEKGNVKVLTGYAFPVFDGKNLIKINAFDESLGSLGGIVSYELNSSPQKEKYAKENREVYDIKQISEQFGILPDVLVIDIEGSETVLLQIEPALSKSIKYILIELHPHLYGTSIQNEIIDSISAQGYKLESNEGDVYLFERLN